MKIQDFNPSSLKYEEILNLDEAEALVTTYPSSSKAWVLYMIYSLKQAEVNKARSVAHRGLASIPFRESGEKLNVWKALLNLENVYGTKDSLDQVLKEALVYNDKETIFNHMIDIYTATGKDQEIKELSQSMLKKFKHKKDVWIKFINYYMKNGQQQHARNLIQRSLQSLPSKEHPDILGKMAHLEYRHGDIERSLTSFEDILMKYPKRKDLKSIYIHILRLLGQFKRVAAIS